LTEIKGIDVSKWQGEIDWQAVKDSGVRFAILRAGYGQGVLDPTFAENAKACNRLGIDIGVYWFSYACNRSQAIKEAEFCLAAIKPYRITYPVCFDFEYDSAKFAKSKGVKVTRDFVTELAVGFLNRIEEGGYYACNYQNLDYSKNYFDPDKMARFDVWYARYTDAPDRACGLWQYTSKGKVRGIAGNVDLNIAFKDYPAIIKRAGLNRLQPDAQAPISGTTTLKKGDKVKVKRAVQYDNGRPFKVYFDEYDVLQVKGDRVVIGVGIVVTAAVRAKDLKKV